MTWLHCCSARLLLALLVVQTVSDADPVERAVEAYLAMLADGKRQSEETPLPVTELDPELVTATRTKETAFETPHAANAVDQATIERRSYRTVPQALRDVPGVIVQETSMGQGSPFIRGFTGFRTLFLIDGVRLNNSTFRAGPNQYWSTVDPYSVARVEIVKGPSSVLYGSDAIGGTVQALTIDPYTYGEGRRGGGKVFYRYASAERSHIGRVEASGTLGEHTGLVVGATLKQFGDLEIGSGTQRNTGYDEADGDIKFEHYPDENQRVVVAYQHVKQDAVPRTHRTVFAVPFAGTTVGDELQRDLDQERWLAYVQYHSENMEGLFDVMRFNLSWHDQSEVRDRVRPPSGGGPGPVRVDQQGTSVGTLGAWAQFESDSAIGRLTYGAEIYHDNVNSFSTSNPIQGPVADDATYDLAGVYVQDRIAIGECWQLVPGVRFNYAAADAKSVADPETGERVGIKDDWSALVGSVRFRYLLANEHWNVFGGASQGFRAPNLSDLTRFDSARTDEFEIPATGLDPEKYVTYELGLKQRADDSSLQLAVFYTDIRDQIVRVPTGETTSDGESVISKANVGDGYVWGIEAGGAHRLGRGWTAFGNITYIEGKVDTFPTSAPVVSREYIDRLMPLTAQAGARWERPDSTVYFEGLVRIADRADRLSTRDQSDTSRIPPGGTPGYAVLHLSAGWSPFRNGHLGLAIENLFDKNYRVHGSGTNMPGRNIVLWFRLDF